MKHLCQFIAEATEETEGPPPKIWHDTKVTPHPQGNMKLRYVPGKNKKTPGRHIFEPVEYTTHTYKSPASAYNHSVEVGFTHSGDGHYVVHVPRFHGKTNRPEKEEAPSVGLVNILHQFKKDHSPKSVTIARRGLPKRARLRHNDRIITNPKKRDSHINDLISTYFQSEGGKSQKRGKSKTGAAYLEKITFGGRTPVRNSASDREKARSLMPDDLKARVKAYKPKPTSESVSGPPRTAKKGWSILNRVQSANDSRMSHIRSVGKEMGGEAEQELNAHADKFSGGRVEIRDKRSKLRVPLTTHEGKVYPNIGSLKRDYHETIEEVHPSHIKTQHLQKNMNIPHVKHFVNLIKNGDYKPNDEELPKVIHTAAGYMAYDGNHRILAHRALNMPVRVKVYRPKTKSIARRYYSTRTLRKMHSLANQKTKG